MRYFLSKLFSQSVKNWLHLSEAVAASYWFGRPARNLRIIGVTGTNGKTTTANLIARILEEDGKRVALASTINFRIAGKEWVNASKFTTLAGWKLHRFLRDARAAGCTHVVLETSSHALDQRRVSGIPYAVAVITNVTREHLDYHKTMEEYRRAKRRLFDGAGIAVVNLDMWEPEFFLEGAAKKKTYGITDHAADIYAEDLVSTLSGSTFTVSGVPFHTDLPGTFNVENALAAIAATSAIDVPLEAAARGIAKVSIVPGRVDPVKNALGATILIDYAVTPDSLEKLYELVSTMKKEGAKIVAVFGACGERDRGKRPVMGEIVSSHADTVILTNEDPYHEDPERILDEIEAGIKGKEKGVGFFRIFDRREAICKALSLLRPDDILLVTGKGAEETMAIGDERIPWNDRTVIEEELKRLES
jgi:UDP-N-acetylmuramoyl-L-alanyl-D-glutamate--2,6-diaminopimelate ligase